MLIVGIYALYTCTYKIWSVVWPLSGTLYAPLSINEMVCKVKLKTTRVKHGKKMPYLWTYWKQAIKYLMIHESIGFPYLYIYLENN